MTGEAIGQLIIGMMVACGWLFNHLRAKVITKKVDRIEEAVNGPMTLLIRQKAIDKRRIARLEPTPENIAEAEAAEAAVTVREDGKALSGPVNDPKRNV